MPYSRLIGMPSMLNVPEAELLLLHELQRCKESLEKVFGVLITDEDLIYAIELHNTNRQLLRQVFQLRRHKPPLLTGTEFLAIVLSSMLTRKEEHNQLLQRLLAQINDDFSNKGDDLPRIMLVGSELDNLDIVRLIEEPGAVVVADDLCTGLRYFWNDCVLRQEPLLDLARRYLDVIPCPTKYPIEPRYGQIFNLIEEYEVQGVIILLQKFCNPHEFELPHLQGLLRDRGIPFICIELDTTYSAEEIQNQAEALIERIE